MRGFQFTYIGRHDFPSSLASHELQRWFTFDAKIRRNIRKAFRSRYWIGVALQLGFVSMTGTTLRSLEYVPQAILRHLGRQFVQKAPDLATLRSLYRRSQTRFQHQRWAIEQSGLREFDSNVQQQLSRYLHERTHATLSRVRLEQMARERLYSIYIAIPRRRVITDLVRRVTKAVMLEDHRLLRQHMAESPVLSCLRDLLVHRPGSAMTHLEWLRRPPRRRSLKTLRELLEKYQWLEERVGRHFPLPIAKERQRVYARRLRRRRAAHVCAPFGKSLRPYVSPP